MSKYNHEKNEISGNIRAKEAAAYLGIGLSTFWLWVKQGKILPPIRHSPRVSVWQAAYILHLSKHGVENEICEINLFGKEK